MRRLMWALAASAITGLASSAMADDNQALADAIASRVQQTGDIKGYNIDIETNAGIVTLSVRSAPLVKEKA